MRIIDALKKIRVYGAYHVYLYIPRIRDLVKKSFWYFFSTAHYTALYRAVYIYYYVDRAYELRHDDCALKPLGKGFENGNFFYFF